MFIFFVIFRIFSCIFKRNGEKNISIFPKAEISKVHILIFFKFSGFSHIQYGDDTQHGIVTSFKLGKLMYIVYYSLWYLVSA